jgi:uncharacterized membrane protein YjjP (DUF1212 family)
MFEIQINVLSNRIPKMEKQHSTTELKRHISTTLNPMEHDAEDVDIGLTKRNNSTTTTPQLGTIVISGGDDVESRSDEDMVKRKRFIMRLVNALHLAGNLSFRTEQYVEQVAQSIGLQAFLKIYPASATLSFYGSSVLAMETYNFRASSGLSAFKLTALDELCYDVITNPSPDFTDADRRLLAIETTPSMHADWVRALGYGFASMTCTTLLFNGSWIDGACAFMFGLLVFVNGYICKMINGMPELESVVAAFIITCLVTLLDETVLKPVNTCVFGQVFGSIAWLLPGLTITISLLEVYSSMIIYGAARLTYGVFIAMQLGFGLSMGYRLASGGKQASDFIAQGCVHPVHDGFDVILLPLLATSFAILVDCSWQQVPGAIFTCAFGYIFTGYVAPAMHLPPDVTPFLSAIVVTSAARVYSNRVEHERPLVFIIVGLCMLVPGGLGVKGMSSMWSGDMWAVMTFTFEMLMVGVSLAVGVFVALLPRRHCFVQQSTRRDVTYSASLAAHLSDAIATSSLPVADAFPAGLLEPSARVELEGIEQNNLTLVVPI